MNLAPKAKAAFRCALQHFPTEWFSAKDLTEKHTETIYAASLISLVDKGLMIKMPGSPVKFKFADNIEDFIAELTAEEDKGCDNTNLARAKAVKNDEFYTQLKDINAEVMKYKKYFKNKAVFCNCNDGEDSQFFQFFLKNFDAFQLKKLVAYKYNEHGNGIKYEVCDDLNNDGFIDEKDIVTTTLLGNGGFNSEESIAELSNIDIVCTNPPFSVFREYIEILTTHKKSFLVIAPQGCTSYKQIFKKIVDGELWMGYGKVKEFMQPDGTTKTFGNICWITNLPCRTGDDKIILTATYYKDINKREDYNKYDNYDAINVDKIKNIPKDYYGVMGVPITILEQYNPEQFEILGCNAYSDPNYYGVGPLYVNDKKKYTRILIRNIENN
jgi:hypothetical protein